MLGGPDCNKEDKQPYCRGLQLEQKVHSRSCPVACSAHGYSGTCVELASRYILSLCYRGFGREYENSGKRRGCGDAGGCTKKVQHPLLHNADVVRVVTKL